MGVRVFVVAGVLAAAGCFGGGPGITPVRTAFNRGVYHHAGGELEAAVAEYRTALADDPADDNAQFNLAVALEQRAAELESGPRAAALRTEATRHYDALLSRRPGHVRAAINRAAADVADDPAGAEARLRALIEARPELAEPRTALAAHWLRAGRREAAVRLLRQAVARVPGDAAAQLLLGRALRAGGDLEGARAALTMARQRAAGRAPALLELARLEVDAGALDEARALLGELLLLDPDHGEAHWEMAAIAEHEGALERAVYHLWRARDLRHQLPPAGRAARHRAAAARLTALYARLARVDPVPANG